MAIPGDDHGERAGDDRCRKRQQVFEQWRRLRPSLSGNEDEANDENSNTEEDVSETRIAFISDDLEDVMTDEQSGSPKEAQYVKLQSSDVLDCPTCYEPLQRPIYQCNNGHLACSSCCTKLNNICSFCKCSIGSIRCRAMETVIESSIVPCPNANYGCKDTTSYGNQSSLANDCAFARCFCPIPDCNYFGSYTELKRHAHATHSPLQNDVVFFEFDTPVVCSMRISDRKKVIFQEKKEGDLVVVQTFKGSSDCGYVTVKRIAPMASSIGDLSCSLAKLNGLSTLRLGFIVEKVHKVTEEMDPIDEAVMVIPPKMWEINDYWMMEICIGTGLKYIH